MCRESIDVSKFARVSDPSFEKKQKGDGTERMWQYLEELKSKTTGIQSGCRLYRSFGSGPTIAFYLLLRIRDAADTHGLPVPKFNISLFGGRGGGSTEMPLNGPREATVVALIESSLQRRPPYLGAVHASRMPPPTYYFMKYACLATYVIPYVSHTRP